MAEGGGALDCVGDGGGDGLEECSFLRKGGKRM